MKRAALFVLFLVICCSPAFAHKFPGYDTNAPIGQFSNLTSFTFDVVGDNRTESKVTAPANKVYKDLVARMAQDNPRFVINVGDLTMHSSAYCKRARNEWTNFSTITNRIAGVPYFIAVGNHDVYMATPNKRDIDGKQVYDTPDLNANVLRVVPADRYYSFKSGNALFIVLNTEETPGDKTTMSSPQLVWLENELVGGFKQKFVFMHRPLSDIANKQELETRLKQGNVTAVFVGHDHKFSLNREYPFEAEPDKNILYLTSGGGGAQNKSKGDTPQFHYIKVKISGNNATFTKIDRDGKSTDFSY